MATMGSCSVGLLLISIALSSFVRCRAAGEFLSAKQVSPAEVEASLVSELAINASRERLQDLETALRPTFSSLPKSTHGYLGYQAVRYALHRLLLQRHGWFIVGLEPSDNVPPPYLQGEWVASYLQGLLEQRLGGRGINLHELAALAAALEDLVHAETAKRIDAVYSLHGLALDGDIKSWRAGEVLTTYMMMYLGANFSGLAPEGLPAAKIDFAADYADWKSAESWLQAVEAPYLTAAGGLGLDFQEVHRAADELGDRFAAFNDGECHSLKHTLLQMEDADMPGRVLLSDFYKKGLHSHWNFDEKVEYLRALGALDESNPVWLRVIVPNYVSSRINCLEASSLYAVCCRNECEDLMQHLEGTIRAPAASVAKVKGIIEALPSDSVAAPRKLSDTLLRRLQEIAERHSGQVPLHGRLFAQWMHHVYPRECPYPPEAGAVSPQTPDEWMRDAGQEGTAASQEERQRHIRNRTCEDVGPCTSPSNAVTRTERVELPWSIAEELLVAPTKTVGQELQNAMKPLMLLFAAIGLLFTGPWRAKQVPAGRCNAEELKISWQAANVRMLLALCSIVAFAAGMGLLDAVAFGCAFGVGFMVLAVQPLIVGARPLPTKLATGKLMEENRV